MKLFKQTTSLNSSGQAVIILLLVLLIALSIGLAAIQKTITNVTTSTQNEQSSRAFSAAEAGIERAIQNCPPGQPNCDQPSQVSLSNSAKADVIVSPPLPQPGKPMEFPPIGKEEVAQFWLANPNNYLSPVYIASSFQIYFGNCTNTSNCLLDYPNQDYPAIEVNVVSQLANLTFESKRYYIDSQYARTTGANGNGFHYAGTGTGGACNPPTDPAPIATTSIKNTTTSQFYCRTTIPCTAGTQGCQSAYAQTPILVRVRLLYSSNPQKLAIVPNTGSSLPPQATIYTSTGTSGQSKKTITVFKSTGVLPNFFDYAIFSAGDITK